MGAVDMTGRGGERRNPLTKWIKRKSREVCPCRQCGPLYIRIHTLILLFLLCVPTKEGRPRLTVTNGGLVLQQITRRARTSQRWNTARSPPLSSFLSHRKGWAALFSFQLRLVPHNGCCHILYDATARRLRTLGVCAHVWAQAHFRSEHAFYKLRK